MCLNFMEEDIFLNLFKRKFKNIRMNFFRKEWVIIRWSNLRKRKFLGKILLILSMKSIIFFWSLKIVLLVAQLIWLNKMRVSRKKSSWSKSVKHLIMHLVVQSYFSEVWIKWTASRVNGQRHTKTMQKNIIKMYHSTKRAEITQ